METGVLIVFTLMIFLITMFIIEPISIDLIALSVPVLLVILQPWTGVTPEQAISGFSSSATITIGAMFVISTGVERSGVVHVMGEKIMSMTGDDRRRQLILIIFISGFVAGLINNTPVVALFIPMVMSIANKSSMSPSKYLIPLSYAAMMGGMLTLIGTSSNIVANDIVSDHLGRGYSMFEFTHLALIAFVIGSVYLIFFASRFIPPRIDPEEELTEEFKIDRYLTEVVIKEDSSIVGMTVEEALESLDYDIDIVQLIRDDQKFFEPLNNKIIQAGDHFVITSDHESLIQVIKGRALRILSRTHFSQEELEARQENQKLVKLVVPHGSFLAGQTLRDVNFLERYQTTALAIRQEEEIQHTKLEDIILQPGAVLLLTAGPETLQRLRTNRNFIISGGIDYSGYRTDKIKISLSILFAVIALAALNVLPIVISALGGVVAMVLTGSLKPLEVYDAVNWNVIFLLSGLIPLGVAMDNTGTAEFAAEQIMRLEGILAPVTILILFYLMTVGIANLVGNNVSVILMLPIAIDAAGKLGLNPLAFALTVTFAASSAFLTPIGYQTNLMVYGPGGYRFFDFFKVGLPLQIIMSFLIPVLIALFWGL
ncbi:SLC13 family permease [Halarsenatibacter silvermanii]|uniref:Di-and tricarboxylate transporter n=1 Tax=Halarsenatibacter silvermanii TaxID=321763 RepID=A0A1G9PGD1_9FIRM|nr:SLC13 family permease [Halarsenatibacter silvermanii]SDL97818.1 Di-and tricarboxylate transporter [Halarsenatibacter silvermanii]